MKPSEPVIELIGVTRQFGAVQALKGVDLSLHPGEVHALVGENGAGKSTLVKMLAGIHQPDVGMLTMNRATIELRNPAQAQALGIAVIHQEPSLFPDLDVAENIFMGRHPRDRLGRVDWRRMYREVEHLLQSLDVQLSVRAPVQGLSIADQQLVEIAKALSLNTRILVMDEPTAALSPHEVQELFQIVRQLRQQGVAILFVSHRLEEIAELADRVTVLRDGAHVITAAAHELSTDAIIRHMVGRELDTLFPKGEAKIGDVVLEARGLTRAGVFRDVSFTLRQGEILGFSGLVGAGRTEVARVLFGIDRADSGTILLKGLQISLSSSRAAMRHGIAYVPEDRHQHGLMLDFTITRNITLPLLDRLSRLGLVDQRREHQLASTYAKQLHVRSSGLDQLARALSGGNQQKVVLGKWLATEPQILILDEPTRGIDIGAKAEVHRIISDLAAQGLAIILISSELPEVLAMSDRVLVMHEGRVAGLFGHMEANQENVMLAATGQVAI
ncbi:sugar ABC transporter ATP-binding protein [Ktedonospora formicarum]|uniref:Ribose import ATP-binding protein RbsA n=1 Tax=Ktedonospora formicarum TaxID=2778364 RepID=A0A8J3I680_9CHLR|nr:sugar ABC transporter ATP-binding protein [Ktedonospora formicarum]GHO51092.1 ribose import ATP-binding protein RbsA [Ktedonospora formicarum]